MVLAAKCRIGGGGEAGEQVRRLGCTPGSGCPDGLVRTGWCLCHFLEMGSPANGLTSFFLNLLLRDRGIIVIIPASCNYSGG